MPVRTPPLARILNDTHCPPLTAFAGHVSNCNGHRQSRTMAHLSQNRFNLPLVAGSVVRRVFFTIASRFSQ